jgi:hypothetical protein
MSEKQKVITFGIPESLYKKMNSSAIAKDQKVSDYMKKFVSDYFTDDATVSRIVLDVPRDKRNDKAYMTAWFKQKSDYLVEYFYNQYNDEQVPSITPSAYWHEGHE